MNTQSRIPMFPDFLTLENYITWRDSMRVQYKTLSRDIRLLKNEINATFKNGGYAGNMQGSLLDLQYNAREMMEKRKQAKVVARNSWEKWKSEEVQKIAA